jgi:plastocyanin
MLSIQVPLADAALRPAETKTITIKDFEFGPKTLTVTVGDTVTWKNEGPSPHTATALGGAFDSGNLDPGKDFSFTFTKAGTFNFACKYHDIMAGTITVAAPAATAAPTSGPTAPPAATAIPTAAPAATPSVPTAAPAPTAIPTTAPAATTSASAVGTQDQPPSSAANNTLPVAIGVIVLLIIGVFVALRMRRT